MKSQREIDIHNYLVFRSRQSFSISLILFLSLFLLFCCFRPGLESSIGGATHRIYFCVQTRSKLCIASVVRIEAGGYAEERIYR